VVKIKTKRLILRSAKINDAAYITQNVHNLDVARYTANIPFPYSIKNAKYFIKLCRKQESQKPCINLNLVIEIQSLKKVIGCIGLIRIDHFTGKADIGYWLGKDYWRQGIGFEAVNALIKFAFGKLKLQRLEAAICIENRASQALVKKAGFKKEGLHRRANRSLATGKLHDIFIYALLKPGKCK
jgi:ribosomal-protein-alanine N-acetyltransferase